MNDESHTFWFTTHGLDDDQFVEELRLVGRLVGLAIYNGVILDVHFPLALWKKIMGVDVDFDDLLSLDPVCGCSLVLTNHSTH